MRQNFLSWNNLEALIYPLKIFLLQLFLELERLADLSHIGSVLTQMLLPHRRVAKSPTHNKGSTERLD